MAEHERKRALARLSVGHPFTTDIETIAAYVASLEARVAELEATCERAAKIIDTNLYRQDEKVSDASTILKAAISDGIGSPITYAIEQAVAKERERCAQVAEGLGRRGREWVKGSLWDNIRRDIAAAIRGQGQ